MNLISAIASFKDITINIMASCNPGSMIQQISLNISSCESRLCLYYHHFVNRLFFPQKNLMSQHNTEYHLVQLLLIKCECLRVEEHLAKINMTEMYIFSSLPYTKNKTMNNSIRFCIVQTTDKLTHSHYSNFSLRRVKINQFYCINI